MNRISPSAQIEENVTLGDDNFIGDRAIIKAGSVFGNGNVIEADAIVGPNVIMGDGNRVHHYAYIGGDPQDLAYGGEKSFVRIGSNNVFREFTTMHRGTKADTATEIGNGNYFMVYSHMGHNAKAGDNCIFTNCTQVGGYAVIGDYVNLSGMCGVHQFVVIGNYSILGGNSAATKDIPPFSMAYGTPAKVVGINAIGLRRRGFSSEDREGIKKMFSILYSGKKLFSDAIQEIESIFGEKEWAKTFVSFYRNSKRGIAAFGYSRSGDE